MPPTSSNAIGPRDVLQLIRRNRKLCIAPAVAAGLLAIFYVLVAPDTWEATQALIVRNEAVNSDQEPGKFRQIDDMKVTQETILEIAKSREVLAKTLAEIGPPANRKETVAYPTPKEIVTFRKAIKLAPPKGAEFGKTEIFYLRVKDHDRQRAIRLATALAGQIQARYKLVLDQKAKSMIAELTDLVATAEATLQAASKRLAEMERSVGSDLAELRILHQNPSGDSDLRKKVVYIEGELNKLDQTTRRNRELLQLLRAAQQDPSHLVAAPNSLLEAQPALRRLKDGLVDAQLRTALLRASMSEEHPQVAAARANENEVRRQLHDELTLAVQAIEGDILLNDGQTQTLQTELNQVRDRLARLASLRTEYSNLAAEVQTRTELLQVAQRRLAEAQGSETGAIQASLISLLDTPDAGIKPIGPSKALIVLAAIVGGGFGGLGLIFLMIPKPATPEALSELDLLTRAAAAAVASPPATTTLPPTDENATEDEAQLQRALRKAFSHGS